MNQPLREKQFYLDLIDKKIPYTKSYASDFSRDIDIFREQIATQYHDPLFWLLEIPKKWEEIKTIFESKGSSIPPLVKKLENTPPATSNQDLIEKIIAIAHVQKEQIISLALYHLWLARMSTTVLSNHIAQNMFLNQKRKEYLLRDQKNVSTWNRVGFLMVNLGISFGIDRLVNWGVRLVYKTELNFWWSAVVFCVIFGLTYLLTEGILKRAEDTFSFLIFRNHAKRNFDLLEKFQALCEESETLYSKDHDGIETDFQKLKSL